MLWCRKPGRSTVRSNSLVVTVGHVQRWLRCVRQVNHNIIRHKQIEQSVTVVINKCGAGTKTSGGIAKAGFFGDVGKGAVSVVSIETVLAVVSQEKVFESVIVVISDANPTCPSTIEQTCLLGYVGEGAIPVVVIETIAGTRRRVFEPPPAYDKDIHPPIVVVVEKSATASVQLYDVSDVVCSACHHRFGEPCAVGNVDETREGMECGLILHSRGKEFISE